MSDTRYFSNHPTLAYEIYEQAADLPLICPHGHVDPRLFANEHYDFGTPVDLLVIPDHYVFRMLYSAGIKLESLGIPRQDGAPVEKDHRKIWQIFGEHFYLFRGTPTGIWIRDELHEVFGIQTPLNAQTADGIYDQLVEKLAAPAFRPRALFERFNIETLATTDAAHDTLAHHQAIAESDWNGRIIPTFRPDGVINLDRPDWRDNLTALEAVTNTEIRSYTTLIEVLAERRAYFKQMGAVATDHGALSAYTGRLSNAEADIIFKHALQGTVNAQDAQRFTGHMLMEMAQMSLEDGLVMQLHVGSLRDHNQPLFEAFGRDMGADMPIQMEFTRNLKPLLNAYGNDPRLKLIVFTLDETTYSRELAPLAGHYPALKLGPPWWFFDSLKGMRRYFDAIIETAGIYNTAGFNDDTRAFPSIPARHDVWRRACADWLAEQVVQGIISQDEANDMMRGMAYDLAKEAYGL